MKDSDFHLVGRRESEGGPMNLGIRVLVASPGRELTESCQEVVSRHADQMHRELLVELAKADRGTGHEKWEWIDALTACFPESVRVHVEEIPNEYCDGACCIGRPWLLVTTSRGVIKIGPRKRVISIDWSESDIVPTADELFLDEDTTKEGRLIHAWGLEKAREYIRRLLGVEVPC